MPGAESQRTRLAAVGWRLTAWLTSLLFSFAGPAAAEQGDGPRVLMVTSHGEIEIELRPGQAPKTVENFLAYVDDGFYAGTVFHRIIPDFMIQGGGLNEDLESLATRDPVVNESDNGLSNERGTLAMARTRDPDSATAQFFINLTDNEHLDGGGQPGYTVFGHVVSGMDVVDRIADLDTGSRGGHRDVPLEVVRIESMRRLDAADSS